MASIIGKTMLESGAAEKIVRSTLKLTGIKHAPLTFLSSSFFIGIPVFFDTVFYLMVPLVKAMAFKIGKNYLLLILCITAGGGGEGEDLRDDEYGEALTPEALTKQVKAMISKYGFGSVKFKAGVLEPELEIETIKLIRQEFGIDIPLRIDPNSAWTVETSVMVGRSLAEELSNGGYLEDPTAGLEGMGAVRKQLLDLGVDTPLASNVAVTSFALKRATPGAGPPALCQS